MFDVTNEQTGKTIITDSNKNYQELCNTLNSVTGPVMRGKAEKELNPMKKRMMLKYADRWDKLHAEGLI